MADEQFHLVSNYAPTGDQPQAIEQLVEGIERGDRCQTLLGVTCLLYTSPERPTADPDPAAPESGGRQHPEAGRAAQDPCGKHDRAAGRERQKAG